MPSVDMGPGDIHEFDDWDHERDDRDRDDFQDAETCDDCEGTGEGASEWTLCATCKGTGVMTCDS